MKKQIVLSGYYGFDNLGYESILSYLVSFLKENDIEPIVLSKNPEKTANTYNVRAINRNDFNLMHEVMKKADGLISGGGSLLQDKTSKKSLLYYLMIMLLAKINKKPVYFYGQGVGPIKATELKWMTKLMLKKTDFLSVRDNESKEFLVKETKLKKKEIHVIHDPVLFSEEINELKDSHSFSKEELEFIEKRPVFISVRPTEANENVIRAFGDYLEYLKSENIPVVSLPYHISQDTKITNHLLKDYENSWVVDRELTLSEASYLLSKSRLVVGMRLHSLIMAASQNTPFIGVSYDPKIDSLLKQFNYTAAGEIHTVSGDLLIQRTIEMFDKEDLEKVLIRNILNEMKKKNHSFNQKILNNLHD
jgi:polysaccharide pyruvyl transferase CsaB